jgi:hypothetical protein
MVVVAFQEVFGKVQPRAGKPFSARELAEIVDHLCIWLGRLDAGELPYRRPEVWNRVDRPFVQLLIRFKPKPIALVYESDERRDVGFFDTLL